MGMPSGADIFKINFCFGLYLGKIALQIVFILVLSNREGKSPQKCVMDTEETLYVNTADHGQWSMMLY